MYTKIFNLFCYLPFKENQEVFFFLVINWHCEIDFTNPPDTWDTTFKRVDRISTTHRENKTFKSSYWMTHGKSFYIHKTKADYPNKIIIHGLTTLCHWLVWKFSRVQRGEKIRKTTLVFVAKIKHFDLYLCCKDHG